MDAKTIKEQMTQGIWEATFTEYPEEPTVIYDGVGIVDNHRHGKYTRKICDSILPHDDETYIKHHPNIEADMTAIATAVNNTYGKGLNPEVYEDVVGSLQSLVTELLLMDNNTDVVKKARNLISKARI